MLVIRYNCLYIIVAKQIGEDVEKVRRTYLLFQILLDKIAICQLDITSSSKTEQKYINLKQIVLCYEFLAKSIGIGETFGAHSCQFWNSAYNVCHLNHFVYSWVFAVNANIDALIFRTFLFNFVWVWCPELVENHCATNWMLLLHLEGEKIRLCTPWQFFVYLNMSFNINVFSIIKNSTFLIFILFILMWLKSQSITPT